MIVEIIKAEVLCYLPKLRVKTQFNNCFIKHTHVLKASANTRMCRGK